MQSKNLVFLKNKFGKVQITAPTKSVRFLIKTSRVSFSLPVPKSFFASKSPLPLQESPSLFKVSPSASRIAPLSSTSPLPLQESPPLSSTSPLLLQESPLPLQKRRSLLTNAPFFSASRHLLFPFHNLFFSLQKSHFFSSKSFLYRSKKAT